VARTPKLLGGRVRRVNGAGGGRVRRERERERDRYHGLALSCPAHLLYIAGVSHVIKAALGGRCVRVPRVIN
jgi:hypothetical protein